MAASISKTIFTRTCLIGESPDILYIQGTEPRWQAPSSDNRNRACLRFDADTSLRESPVMQPFSYRNSEGIANPSDCLFASFLYEPPSVNEGEFAASNSEFGPAPQARIDSVQL